MKLKTANIYLVQSGGIRPVLLELITDDGVTGLGEAGLAYGLGGLAAAGMLKEMIERYLANGREPFRVESLCGRKCTTTVSGPKAAGRWSFPR